MKTIDRIRKYINGQVKAGSITPGSKLPSYRELCDICGGSYVTVRSAVVKLQSEGLIEIRNGSGTYLAGGRNLKVRLNINIAALPVRQMEQLLHKHLAGRNLNLEIEVCPLHKLDEGKALKSDRAMIFIFQTGESVNLPPAELDKFSGYGNLVKELNIVNKIKSRTMLPFATYNYQIGVSQEILRKIGFDRRRMTEDFSWWDEYAACCRKHGIHPASQHWHEKTTWRFAQLAGLMLSLIDCDSLNFRKNLPVFDSDGGRRFLEIIRDTHFYRSVPGHEAFFNGKAGMCFSVGSWVTRQNLSIERPDIAVDELDILPFRRNGRRIFPTFVDYLQSYLADDLSVEERNRVWQLIELMLSREFQLDYCNLTGMISPRKDTQPEEYSWNCNRRWDAFIPDKSDLIFYEDQLFVPESNAALTMLLEDFRLYGADMDLILKRMDKKKDREGFSARIYIDQEEMHHEINM